MPGINVGHLGVSVPSSYPSSGVLPGLPSGAIRVRVPDVNAGQLNVPVPSVFPGGSRGWGGLQEARPTGGSQPATGDDQSGMMNWLIRDHIAELAGEHEGTEKHRDYTRAMNNRQSKIWKQAELEVQRKLLADADKKWWHPVDDLLLWMVEPNDEKGRNRIRIESRDALNDTGGGNKK